MLRRKVLLTIWNFKTGVTRKQSTPNFSKNKHFLPPDTHPIFGLNNHLVNLLRKRYSIRLRTKINTVLDQNLVNSVYFNLSGFINSVIQSKPKGMVLSWVCYKVTYNAYILLRLRANTFKVRKHEYFGQLEGLPIGENLKGVEQNGAVGRQKIKQLADTFSSIMYKLNEF